MSASPTTATLLVRHEDLTAELAASRREYGDVRAAAIVAHSRAFRDNYEHMNVSDRREACKMATADLDADCAKLIGEIEALTAEIDHIKLQLEYSDANPT